MVTKQRRAARARASAQTNVEIISISETTLAAFAVARVALALLLLGGVIVRGSGDQSLDEALVTWLFIAAAAVGVVHGMYLLWNRSRNIPLGNPTPWIAILIDSLIAIGSMIVVDAESTPLGWLALLVPVVETAVLVGVIPGALVWLGLSIAFLSLRLSGLEGDVGSSTLSLAIQQVVAVFLVSGPAALLTDGTRHRINNLADARRDADQMVDRLRRIADSARAMSKETSAEGVLMEMSSSAVTLGFERADVVTRTGDEPWRQLCVHSNGVEAGPPASLLTEDFTSDGIISIEESHADAPQLLHDYNLSSGHAIRINDSSGADQYALRAWSRHRAALEGEVRALELLVNHAREVFRTSRLLEEAQSHADQLLNEVRHDGLTGLANRSFVLETLEQRIAEGARMAILFLDLDGFKELNDSYGHRAGDAALQIVAGRLSDAMRSGSLAGRMGGDEFIALIPVTAFESLELLDQFAKKLETSVSAPMVAFGNEVTLGVSIGVALHAPGIGADQLISLADTAMYVAKRSGGGVRFSDQSATELAS
ncbi:MAG: GGDEF domain-containing protein [Acidimicrobiales bacterium]|nr:GGDEF domain-containing protein [Acidimicrobiales bacterium]